MWKCKKCGSEILERNNVRYGFQINLSIPKDRNTKKDLGIALDMLKERNNLKEVCEKKFYCSGCCTSVNEKHFYEIAKWEDE